MIRRVFLGVRVSRAHLAIAAVVLLLLISVPVTFAAVSVRIENSVLAPTTECLNCTPWRTINTSNGIVDDLGSANTYVPSPSCANASLADYLEVKQATIVNDGSGFYFRIELCAAPTTQQRTNLRMGAGLDCNHDGDTADAWGGQADPNTGDRKVVYWIAQDQVVIVDGGNSTVLQLSSNGPDGEELSGSTVYEWRAPLERIYPDCRGSVSTIGIGLGTVLLPSPATRDQTPDYDWSHPIDYGDALNPDPTQGTCSDYPSRVGCDGARHGLYTPAGMSSTLLLGGQVDADDGTNQDAGAIVDDTRGIADEDGVEPTPGVNWVANGQGSISATVSGGSGYLNCWVDWNNDKDWADTGEKILSDSAVAAGLNARTFSVPSGTTFPNSFVSRCRLAPGANLATAVTGATEFGEVEDYLWYFGSTGNRPAPVTVTPSPSGTTLQVSWSNIASNESYLVSSSTAPYFNPGDTGVTTVTDSSSPYDVTGVVGGTADTLFYLVQGRVTSSASPTELVSTVSNRAGLWEFALLPGQ